MLEKINGTCKWFWEWYWIEGTGFSSRGDWFTFVLDAIIVVGCTLSLVFGQPMGYAYGTFVVLFTVMCARGAWLRWRDFWFMRRLEGYGCTHLEAKRALDSHFYPHTLQREYL